MSSRGGMRFTSTSNRPEEGVKHGWFESSNSCDRTVSSAVSFKTIIVKSKSYICLGSYIHWGQ